MGGAAATGARFSSLSTREIAIDAIKLDLLARIADKDDAEDDERMRRVVESLQESINRLAERTDLLVSRIAELKKEKAISDNENGALRSRIKDLERELDELKEARVTLSVVKERIPEASAS